MTLETLVCSLPLAKKLRELGVPQKSVFYWDYISDDGNTGILLENDESDGISAFTAGELGEMLPQTVDQEDEFSPYFLNIHQCTIPRGRCWQVRYGTGKDGDNTISITRDTLADSFATMLIYLIEKGLWKP